MFALGPPAEYGQTQPDSKRHDGAVHMDPLAAYLEQPS
jgi:hypothetical protein